MKVEPIKLKIRDAMKYILISVTYILQFVSIELIAQNKKVEYNLYINDTIVNYTGKSPKAMAIIASCFSVSAIYMAVS